MIDGIEYMVNHRNDVRRVAPTQQISNSVWATLPIPWGRTSFPAWSALHGDPWKRNSMFWAYDDPTQLDPTKRRAMVPAQPEDTATAERKQVERLAGLRRRAY